MKNYPFDEARKEIRGYKKRIERRHNERRANNTRDFDQSDWQYEEENYRRRER